MKALRFHGKEDIRVETVADPAPGAGEAKIRNAYAGICGSDLHIYYAP
jgi:(R,R)-butanediol dehydrogenase / meso-butanediol dehydrogenase / diacetyl reductase